MKYFKYVMLSLFLLVLFLIPSKTYALDTVKSKGIAITSSNTVVVPIDKSKLQSSLGSYEKWTEMVLNKTYTSTYPQALDYNNQKLTVKVDMTLIQKKTIGSNPVFGAFKDNYNSLGYRMGATSGSKAKVVVTLLDSNNKEVKTDLLFGIVDPDESNYLFTTSGRKLYYIDKNLNTNNGGNTSNTYASTVAGNYMVASDGLYVLQKNGTKWSYGTPAPNGDDALFLFNFNNSSKIEMTVDLVSNQGTITFPSFYRLVNVKQKVNYVLNGGTNNSSNPTTYLTGTEYTIKNPTRKGYKFLGWKEGNKISIYDIGDKTFTAQWEAYKVNIKYNMNGGKLGDSHGDTIGESNQVITNNGNVLYTTANYDTNLGSSGLANYNNTTYINIVRTGYKAPSGAEWIDSKGNTYDQSTVYPANNFCDASTKDCTAELFVNWKLIPYTINYNLNGGTNNSSNPNSYNIESDNIIIKNPSKIGRMFLGWKENTSGEVFPTIPKGTTGNKTYTALWSGYSATEGDKIDNDFVADIYKLDLNANGGEFVITDIGKDGDNYILPTPEKDGYKFLGYSTTKNGEVEYSNTLSLLEMRENNKKTLYAIYQLFIPINITANVIDTLNPDGLMILNSTSLEGFNHSASDLENLIPNNIFHDEATLYKVVKYRNDKGNWYFVTDYFNILNDISEDIPSSDEEYIEKFGIDSTFDLTIIDPLDVENYVKSYHFSSSFEREEFISNLTHEDITTVNGENYEFTSWAKEQNGESDEIIFVAKYNAPSPKTATFVNGETFNYFIFDNKLSITQFLKSDNLSNNANIKIVSTEDSEYPIYAWIENDIMYYYSEADNIYLNENSSNMFASNGNLINIDGLKYLDTSKVTNMYQMFGACGELSDLTPISNWDVSNVKNMGWMFQDMYNLSDLTPISNWDVSKVEDMSLMFQCAVNLEDISPLYNWNTISLTNASGMFEEDWNIYGKLKIMSNIENIDYMLYTAHLDNDKQLILDYYLEFEEVVDRIILTNNQIIKGENLGSINNF